MGRVGGTARCGKCVEGATYGGAVTSREARHPRPRTIWDEGRTPGSEVAALLVALLLSVLALDLLLSGRLGLLFDLAFVTLCMGAAIAVRPSSFFTVGVLPPLAMLLAVLLVAVAEPSAVAHRGDGFVQATISGLANHGVALAVGYLLCLGVLGTRRHLDAGDPSTAQK